MELMLDECDVFWDEDDVILRLDNGSGMEEDDLKTEFEKTGSQKLCSCGSKRNITDSMDFIRATKSLSGEFRASNSMNIISTRSSLYNIPLNLCSSGLFLERLDQHRRTRSINDFRGVILEHPQAVGSGNFIISPSRNWILNSIEGALLKSSLLFQFGAIDGATSQVIAKSVNHRQTTTSNLIFSPSGLYHAVPQKPEGDTVLFEKQISETTSSEKMFIACSSTNSTSSYQATSSSHSSFSKGMLRCVRKSAKTYFVFWLDGDLGNVYITDPQKVESSINKALDYVYLFYSVKVIPNCGNKKSIYVGKMKVSSSVVLNMNMSKVMETEFVLVSASEDHSMEIQSSSSPHMKSNSLSKKVTEVFKPSHSFKHKPAPKIGRIGESGEQNDESVLEPFLCELCDFSELGSLSRLDDDFAPGLELAAIIVKDYQHESNNEVAVCGWGLKFLEKTRDANISHESSVSSGIHKEKFDVKESEGSRRMNVLVPAGVHGGPSTKTGGPSSLTDRWQSGGQCDCGGWDIGCPLTILKDTSNNSRALNEENSQNDSKSVTLFTEGSKDSEPALRMVNTNKDLYCVDFRSTLSTVQSFSIAVAFIHTQTPTLYPKF